jgi:hypothetical protein
VSHFDSVLLRVLDDGERADGASSVSDVQVFVSFDVHHDGELYELLLAQSRNPSSGFFVSCGSEQPTDSHTWSERARLRIREADLVIVICGEHTESSTTVSAELRIVQEERIPYFLIWGRREIMCTKPIGAKPTDGIYSWTRQILQDRMIFTCRNALADAMAESQGTATHKS